MSDSSILVRFLRPLREGRLWVIVIWSLALAVGAAGWDFAERAFEDAAAGQRAVLLPGDAATDAERETLRAKAAAESGVLSAEWIAPPDLTQRIATLFPQSEWQELFPPDEAWLGWVLEVRPAAPLDAPGLMRAFADRERQSGAWRMVLWDAEPVAALARQRAALRVFLGCWLALLGLGGVAALLRTPWPRGRRLGFLFWSALLGVLGPAAVWSAVLLGGGEPDPRALSIALALGFILATFVAPVLRLPEGNQKISLTLGEDPDERMR